MKAPVSLCMIVRNEASRLDRGLQSVRDFVEEICIVDTGSTDGTPEIAKKYADKFEVYTECNDAEGRIRDFSDARSRAFALGSQPWRFWMDGDDELRGAEKLPALVARLDRERGTQNCLVLMPYEYAHDAQGHCTLVHYRERLANPSSAFQWYGPVHEVLIPQPGTPYWMQQTDDVVFVHRRDGSGKPVEPNRNLRILKDWYDKHGESDARFVYYLGLEYGNAGDRLKSIEILSRYVELSGWDDEACLACTKIAQHHEALGDHKKAIEWGLKAISRRENWFDGYYTVARGYYHLATQTQNRRDWERCVHFGRLALAQPPTNTVLFVNPVERAFDIHNYLNVAYNSVGDTASALESAKKALEASPTDTNLAYNRRLYERHLVKQEVSAALDRLVACEALSESAKATVLTSIEGAAPATTGYRRPPDYPRGVTSADFPVAAVGAWSIPEAWELDGLPLRMSDKQLQSLTTAVWHEYMLHDEVIAAERLLKDAPYRVKHSVGTERALRLTQTSIAWMDNPTTMQAFNQPENPDIEQGVPLPGPFTAQLLSRFEIVKSTLKPEDEIIDFGCSDGSMDNRLALLGFNVTGVDVCTRSVEMARRKAEEFQTGATYLNSLFEKLEVEPRFSVAICSDTYEHMRDPVRDLIAPARRALRPDGRMVLVTPHGAWMRGEYVPWAHPWRWAQDAGKAWISDEPRAHVIAPTPWTVAEHFRQDGWWVKSARALLYEGPHPDAPGQGHVTVEAYVMGPHCEQPLDIVIACGDCWEAWTPETARIKGIGGSETAVIEMGKRLAALGHRVRVYVSCGADGEGIYDGVEYRTTDKLAAAAPCDVLIAWRYAPLLTSVQAKVRMLWVHDVYAHAANHRLLLEADKVLALSEWHRQLLIRHHNLPAEQVFKTRNGIDLARFDPKVKRNPKKVVYSSSPDRGLESLLQMWPAIRQRVPAAELHIFYGFDVWEKVARAQNDGNTLARIELMKSQIALLGMHGVVLRGRVDQQTLAREFLSAGAWLYPTWFTETNCVTAAEAQAAGLRIVTSPIAALNETVGDRGVMIEGDWLTAPYQNAFIEAAVTALTTPSKKFRLAQAEQARERFSWDDVASEWVDLMRGLLARVRDSPLVPYRAARRFSR